MKLKQRPPFTGNQRGHCALYAIANALHGFPKVKKSFDKYSHKESGYMLSEQAEIVDFISSSVLKLAILYYAPALYLKEEAFRQFCPYKENSEQVFSDLPKQMIFTPIIFSVVARDSEMHSISAYYSFDSDSLICMDSAGEGSIFVEEVASFFKKYKVYGVSTIVQQDDESKAYYAALFDRSQLKIYE